MDTQHEMKHVTLTVPSVAVAVYVFDPDGRLVGDYELVGQQQRIPIICATQADPTGEPPWGEIGPGVVSAAWRESVAACHIQPIVQDEHIIPHFVTGGEYRRVLDLLNAERATVANLRSQAEKLQQRGDAIAEQMTRPPMPVTANNDAPPSKGTTTTDTPMPARALGFGWSR